MRIPKRFFWYWNDDNPPKVLVGFRETWERHHPDWEMTVWNEDKARSILPDDLVELFDDPEKFSPTSNEHQWRSNIFRLVAIRDMGGVWVDSDFECFKNIEPLIGDAGAFTCRENDRFVNNGLTGARAGHAVFRWMVDQIRPRVLAKPHWRSNRTTGPHLYTEAVERFPNRVKVIDRELVYPIPYQDAEPYDPEIDYAARFPDAYASHYWNNAMKKINREFR